MEENNNSNVHELLIASIATIGLVIGIFVIGHFVNQNNERNKKEEELKKHHALVDEKNKQYLVNRKLEEEQHLDEVRIRS